MSEPEQQDPVENARSCALAFLTLVLSGCAVVLFIALTVAAVKTILGI